MWVFATWWAWALAAAILAILEVLAPTYVLMGFAGGAALVSVGLLTGLLSGIVAASHGLAWLAVIFAVASLAIWVGLRVVFGKPGQTAQTFDHDIND